MNPGKQPDGSWYVPLLLLRKDAMIAVEGAKRGRVRSKAYRDKQKEARSHLIGIAQRCYIAKDGHARNVKLELTVLLKGYSAVDLVTQLDSLQDTLEGLAYEDDRQVGEVHLRWKPAEAHGLWFRISRL